MKQAMMIFVCLALLLAGHATAFGQAGDEKDTKIWLGAGFGTRITTGDTPALLLGETSNMWSVGAHGLFALNPKLAIAADWSWGWREVKYTSSTTLTDPATSVDSKSLISGWALNALITATLPVGDGLLYAGPGLAVIWGELQRTEILNGVETRTTLDFGTNVGFVAGAGAIMPLKTKWHAFFSMRYAIVTGEAEVATTQSSVKTDYQMGGPSVLVGVGYGF
jgi:hypothetical protein